MFGEFSIIKYLKQYYTDYSFYGIKHWRVYYYIFTRDDSELKYSRLNKGNKSFSRKWPENWNSLYPQTFENVHKIALRLSKKTAQLLTSLSHWGRWEYRDLWRKWRFVKKMLYMLIVCDLISYHVFTLPCVSSITLLRYLSSSLRGSSEGIT